MLDHIAEQIGVEADVIAQFARRVQTRYEQLAVIKRRYNYCDLTRPGRAELAAWLAGEAIGLTDGKILIERLIIRMREQRIIIPGVSVIERKIGRAPSELQSLMRISYAVFCLKKKKRTMKNQVP